MTQHLAANLAAPQPVAEEPARFDESSSAWTYCAETLQQALRTLSASSAALLAVNDDTDFEVVVTIGDNLSIDSSPVGAIAHQARRSRRPETYVGLSGSWHGTVAAIPAAIDDDVVVVAVLTWREVTGTRKDACAALLGPMLVPLALSVERLRIHAALEDRATQIKAMQRQLDIYAVDFRSTYSAERQKSEQLAAALGALEETYRATVHGLAVAVDAKDECTGGHLQRVRTYGMTLTALVAPEHAEDPQFEYGFLLHDIGKLTVPDVVLTKPDALDESEWAMMREHPEAGHSILEDIPFLAGAREIVRSHHERWDGRGYPNGLAGDEIPLGAQIFPLCDAFDAMLSDRPYRKAISMEKALGEIRAGSGTQFWPGAVEAFFDIPVNVLQSIRVESDESGG